MWTDSLQEIENVFLKKDSTGSVVLAEAKTDSGEAIGVSYF